MLHYIFHYHILTFHPMYLQKLDGDFMNICQQSASRIIATVSHAIALQMKRFIKYPCAVEDINQIKYVIL